MGCQQQSFDLSWSVTNMVCAQIPYGVYQFIDVCPSLLCFGDLQYSTDLPLDRYDRYVFCWLFWLHAGRSMPLILSPKFFQEEAWAQDSSKLHAMCAVIAEGDLLVKRTKMLQLKLTMYRSAGGLTSSEFGTSNEIKTTSGQAMKHWKAGLSAREALGSKMNHNYRTSTSTYPLQSNLLQLHQHSATEAFEPSFSIS